MITVIIGIVVVIVIVCAIAGIYNNMVTKRNRIDNAWQNIDTQLQRRNDLIPNLVETVKGYAAHESETLESVTRARAGLTDAYNAARDIPDTAPADQQALDAFNNSQSQLGRAFSVYVNAVREAYPDLKADGQFQDLQTQLEGTENRIATERGRYTEAVRDYNIRVRKFPASIVASLSGFAVKPQFQADAAAATAPKVEF